MGDDVDRFVIAAHVKLHGSRDDGVLAEDEVTLFSRNAFGVHASLTRLLSAMGDTGLFYNFLKTKSKRFVKIFIILIKLKF